MAGVDATTTNGYANWRAMVPLTTGDNTLAVETTDAFSNIDSNAATLTVEFNGPLLRSPQDIALDAANDRALVVDTGLTAVVKVDLVTGARTILSDGATPAGGVNFSSPFGIALDPANNRALVVDEGLAAVVAVEPASGDRVIVSK